MNERELLTAVADAAETLLTQLDEKALGLLRQRVKTLRDWQEHGNEAERPRHLRVQSCKYCEAPFFFAVRGEDSTPVVRGQGESPYSALVGGGAGWLPLEVDPIDSEGVLPEWRWLVDFSDYPPRALVDVTASGSVYVDHRQTCGARDGPQKRCVPYLRRWKANAAKVNAEMDNEAIRTANDLLSLQRRLVDKEKHDDS
jgi:hypothetical protein